MTTLDSGPFKGRSIEFQCCFCKEGMPPEEAAAVILVVDWGRDKDEHGEGGERSQQWFCHRLCFEKVTGEYFDA